MPKPNTPQSRPRKTKVERPVEGPEEFRLQKFLASAGLGSRRKCEEIIRSGRIMVDGEPVDNPGMNVNPLTQIIAFDEERLRPQPHKYFALNKPKGVLCTNHDPAGRARVIDLFEKERVRLFPVGRLDEESEGLLIVTNDGEFANQLAHPRYRIYRTYRVQVVGDPKPEQIQQLKQGIYFKEGKFKFVNVHRAGRQGRSTFLEVTLGQGHNREVRRLFARIGHKVMSLERIAFGPIKLGKLKSGQYRPLTAGEMDELREMLVRNRQTLTPSPEKAPRLRKPAPKTEGEGKREGDRRPASARKSATPQKKRIVRKPKSNSPVSRKK